MGTKGANYGKTFLRMVTALGMFTHLGMVAILGTVLRILTILGRVSTKINFIKIGAFMHAHEL